MGPAGVGKSRLIKHLTSKHPDVFGFSVSATTRAPREGEVHGKDYFFLTEADFQTRVAHDEFIEHCTVRGQMYGTPKSQVRSSRDAKKVPLLDIDT